MASLEREPGFEANSSRAVFPPKLYGARRHLTSLSYIIRVGVTSRFLEDSSSIHVAVDVLKDEKPLAVIATLLAVEVLEYHG